MTVSLLTVYVLYIIKNQTLSIGKKWFTLPEKELSHAWQLQRANKSERVSKHRFNFLTTSTKGASISIKACPRN